VNKLNESDIVQRIFERKFNASQKDIKEIMDLFIDISKESLINGISINLKGFVTLKCEPVKSKKIYSFKDKTSTELPKRILPKAAFNRKFINKIKEINNAG